ncbi:MAG: hypothetical protein KJP16_03970 [Gammaproteobacteria bacterium]|nr:hypothetical protein [Gammaproteobacteria bacterium]NNL49953.1 hypothetical protein [Woeseiaceae bacterium]
MRFDVKTLVKNGLLPAKNALRRAFDYHSHWEHRIEANSILKTLEGKLGKTDPKNIKLANEYAREVLGHTHYAPWLYVYTALTGTFKEGWIPDNYYGSVVVPRLKGSYGNISSLKPLTYTIFKSDTFPDIASFVNGLFLTIDNTPINHRDVENFLFNSAEKIVFKVDNSKQGDGVFFFEKKSFDIEKIKLLGNGVFQSYLVQHKLFDDFAPNSVATLRMTTVVNDGGSISLRACYLRLGRINDTHIQSKSHIRVPVDLSSGEFSTEGYLPNWLTVKEHPDTKMKFSGCYIPSFAQCVSTVLELHKKAPFARSIGWDVTVDIDNNVKLIEWNGAHNDIRFTEATQGPSFADLGWDRLSSVREIDISRLVGRIQ